MLQSLNGLSLLKLSLRQRKIRPRLLLKPLRLKSKSVTSKRWWCLKETLILKRSQRIWNFKRSFFMKTESSLVNFFYWIRLSMRNAMRGLKQVAKQRSRKRYQSLSKMRNLLSSTRIWGRDTSMHKRKSLILSAKTLKCLKSSFV